jgi:hypothetical protein
LIAMVRRLRAARLARETERARLQLVGAACEVAVLVTLMHQELDAAAPHPEVEKLRDASRQHGVHAQKVLAADADMHALPLRRLRRLAADFHHCLDHVRELRDRVQYLAFESETVPHTLRHASR